MMMMRRRLVLLAAVATLAVGQPEAARAQQEESCEDLCGELAAANCENIDSFKCAMYIMGCLVGCSVEKIVEAIE